MIRFNFVVENPWSSKFSAGRCWGGHLCGNKAWEAQIYRTNVVVEASAELSTRCDHSGFRLDLGLLSLAFALQIYDTRHWNYEKERYE